MKNNGNRDFDGAAYEFDEVGAEEAYEAFLAKKKRSDDGFICYYGDWLDVMRGLSSAAKDLLTWLAFNCEMNTGRVFMQSLDLQRALGDLGITAVTYYRALNDLKELGVVKGNNAKFYLNPQFVWKGTSDMRSDFMSVFPRFK